MWLLLPLLILVNALADNKTFILEYRIDFSGLPINILDGLIVACCIMACFPWRDPFPAERSHPLLPVLLGLFVVAIIFGVFTSTLRELPLKWVLIPLRNMLVVPGMLWVGYRAMARPRSCLRISYLYLAASILSAVLVLLFVRDTTETVATSDQTTFDLLRGTSSGGDWGLAAAGLILFAAVERVRLIPKWLGILAICLCGIAFFLVPHRSNWVMAAGTVLFAVFLLPRTKPAAKLAIGLGALVSLVLALVIAVQVVSSITGKDFAEYTTQRLASLLPGRDMDTQTKAWDTRVPGAVRELELWIESPLFGRGFGYQSLDGLSHPEVSYNHTPWVAVACQTGILGLLGYFLLIVGPIVIGWRMVRDAVDRSSVLMGALGAMVGVAAFMIGFMSLSWNGQRQGTVIALMCGMVLRCRAMQLTARRMREEQVPEAYGPAAMEPMEYPAVPVYGGL